ncbi:MAG TPA: MBL fold metallo-hydrolase [bacterium]|nr:MBL fold metallo-hydrolase [bacterium]
MPSTDTKILRQFIVLIAGLAVLVSFAGACQAALQVIGIDVGQGDCTLIISPTGKTVLIDAGDTGKGTGKVLPYLQSRGIKSLDYTIASHYHSDHVGGMDEVINALTRDSLKVAAYDRGWSYTTQAYTQYATAVGSKRQTITEGQVIDIGGGATLKCLALNSHGRLTPPYDNGIYDENNLSVVMLLDYGEFEMELGGDLPGKNTSSYYDIESLVAPLVGDLDVYKVHHHGGANASNTTWLNATLPEVAMIYCGNGNSYGHPTQAVIDRLVAVGSYIYQTELGTGGTIPSGKGKVVSGNIVITVDGGTYNVNGDVYSLGMASVPRARGPVFLTIYPNPFSSEATMRFNVAEPGPVAVNIFDVQGRLVNSFQTLGANSYTWDGTSLDKREVPSGVYFVRISGPSQTMSEKLVKR